MADDTAVDAPGARDVGCSWKCLADADAVRAVTGPRVQLLCVDASPRLVVFGSSIGSVYVFERRTLDGDAFDETSDADAMSRATQKLPCCSSPLPEEGALRFLERFMVETFQGGSASRPVTKLRLNEQRTKCALAFDDGEVVVVAFADPHRAAKVSKEPLASFSGRYEAGIPKGHKGANVTSVAWSPSGAALISGDDAGAVSVVHLEGPSAGAYTVRFDAPVVQTAFADVDGGAAIVSTTTQLSLLHRANGFKKTPIGTKPRDGAFGASAHRWTRAAVPEETLLQLEAEEAEPFSDDNSVGAEWTKTKRTKTGESAKSEYWMFGARPGRRLWVCRAATAGELSEAKVLATVRPSVPEASASPGSREAPLASRLTARKNPKKWEFGALHALGPCVLSASEKAIAVVDIVSAVVLAWYPLAPSRGSEEKQHEGMGAPRDLATRGARAFALGSDGGVWCLHAPANEAQLAAASAALAREARLGIEAEAGETTTETETSSSDPAVHLERIERRLRCVAAPPSAAEAAGDENASDEPRAASASSPEEPSSSEPPNEQPRKDASDSGSETTTPTSPSTEIGFITRRRRGAATPPATPPRVDAPEHRPTSPFPVMVDGVVIDVVTETTLRQAEQSSRGAAAEARAPEETRRRDDDDGASVGRRTPVNDGGASATLNDADRDVIISDALVLEETSAPSSSEVMVESEDTSTSSEKSVSPVSEDRDKNPPRVRTRLDKNADAESAPTSPTSEISESEISAPDSPQATLTNQLFPADMNPWWMRLIGCGGCGPVRSNKQEKSGLGMNW